MSQDTEMDKDKVKKDRAEREARHLPNIAAMNINDDSGSDDDIPEPVYERRVVEPLFSKDMTGSDVAGPPRSPFITTRVRNPYFLFPWIQEACKIMRSHITQHCIHKELLTSMDRYIRYIREHLCTFVRYPNQCFVLARTMTQTMFVFKHLNKGFTDSHEYLLRITEMLGIYTFFELKYSAQYCMSKYIIAERLSNNYDAHLEEVEISYLLRIFLYVQQFCHEAEVMGKLFEKYLNKPRKGKDAEMTDKKFVLHIVVYKIWRTLLCSNINEQMKVDEFANSRMKPPPTFRTNARYAPHIPVYKVNDENATRSILQKRFDIRNIIKILRAEDKMDKEDKHVEVIDLDSDEEDPSPESESVDLVDDKYCDNNEDVKHELPSVVETIDLTDDDKQRDLSWLAGALARAKEAKPLANVIDRTNQSEDRVIEVIELLEDEEEDDFDFIIGDPSSNVEDIESTNDDNAITSEEPQPGPSGIGKHIPNVTSEELQPGPSGIGKNVSNITSEESQPGSSGIGKNVSNVTSAEPQPGPSGIGKNIPNVIVDKEIQSPVVDNNSEQNLLNKTSSTEAVAVSDINTEKSCPAVEAIDISDSTIVDTCIPIDIEDSDKMEVAVSTSETEKECNIVNNEELPTDVPDIDSNLNNLDIDTADNINKNVLPEIDQLMPENDTNKNIMITSTPIHTSSTTEPEDSVAVQNLNDIEMSATPEPVVTAEKIDEAKNTATEDAFLTADGDVPLSPIPSPYMSSATDRHESPTEFLFRDHDDGNHCREIQTNGFDDNISYSTSQSTVQTLNQSVCLKTYEGKRKNYPQPSINLTEVPVRESIGLDPPIFSPYSSDDSRDSIALSILEESETPDSSKDDDMHIDKILPTTTAKVSPIKPTTDGNVVFSISAGKKLSLPPPPPDDDFDMDIDMETTGISTNVVFSTHKSTSNQRNDVLEKQDKNVSLQIENVYTSPDTGRNNSDNDELDEIKSPPVEGFSASDADELVELIDQHSKGTKINYQKPTEKAVVTVTEVTNVPTNIFINDADSVNETADGNYQRRSIHFDTSEDFPTDTLPSSYQKRKTVSFAELKNDKPTPFVNRIKPNTDSTILERKTYDYNKTYKEPNTWMSQQTTTTTTTTTTSINNTINQQKTQYDIPTNTDDDDDIVRASISRNKDTDDEEKIVRYCSEYNSKELKRNILKKVFNPIRSRRDQWEINRVTPKMPDPVIKLPFKPAKALSDFDRYLAERKRRESITSISPSPIMHTPIMHNKLLQSPLTKSSNINKKNISINTNFDSNKKDERKLNTKLINNNLKQAFNDPKLKRKTLVKLIPLHQDKSYYTQDCVSDSSDKKSSKNDKHKDRSSRKRHRSKNKRSKSSGDSSRGKDKKKHSSSKRRSASENFRSTKEKMILDSMNAKKPVVRIKKGVSLVPEIVVRIFKHKNKCTNIPCVMLRRLKSMDLVDHNNFKDIDNHIDNVCNNNGTEINLQTEIINVVTETNNTEEKLVSNNNKNIIDVNEIENNIIDIPVSEINPNNTLQENTEIIIDDNEKSSIEFIDVNLLNKDNDIAQLLPPPSIPNLAASINNTNNTPEVQPNRILAEDSPLNQDSSNDSCNASIDVNFDESDVSNKGLGTPIPSPIAELSITSGKYQASSLLDTHKLTDNTLTTKRIIPNFNDETIKNILNISYTSESEAKSVEKSPQLDKVNNDAANHHQFVLNTSAQKYLTERQEHENEVTSTQGNNNIISITEATSSTSQQPSSSSSTQRLIYDYTDLVQNDEVDTSNPSAFKLRYRRGRSNNVITYAESDTSLEGTLKRRRSLSNNADSSSTFYTDFIQHHDEPPNAPSTTTTDIDIDTWSKKKRIKLTKTNKPKRNRSVKNNNNKRLAKNDGGNNIELHKNKRRKLLDDEPQQQHQSTQFDAAAAARTSSSSSTNVINPVTGDIFDFTDDEATTTTTFTTASSFTHKSLNFHCINDNDCGRIESPEINVNLESTYKIYSKNSLVQNVFVPPEVEKIIEDNSSAATIVPKKRKRGRPRKTQVI